MLDYKELSWGEMTDIVRALWQETKRRNPLGVNIYRGAFQATWEALEEIDMAEKANRTCDDGPTSSN